MRNCRTYRTSKPSRRPYNRLLKTMPLPYELQEEIAIDFVVKLPPSKLSKGVTYKNILTVTNRFSKERHLILAKLITVQNTARLFVKYVFSRHGLLKAITSDRGTQFVLLFQKYVCKILNITQRLSLAYYLEIDGQSERTNQSIEQYLRAYVNYK